MAHKVGMLLNLLAVLGIAGELARAAEPSVISGERIKAAVAHLSSDQLEGRAPGTNGEILATEFIADGLTIERKAWDEYKAVAKEETFMSCPHGQLELFSEAENVALVDL